MIRQELATQHEQAAEIRSATLTMFAIPRKFEGQAGVIQRNAIRSWAELQPHVDIILFGQDDPELEKIASETDAIVLPLQCNEQGTPVLSDAFQQAHGQTQAELLCYVNCDIIFGPDLLEVVERLTDSDLDSFLAIGQRTDLPVEQEIRWSEPDAFAMLKSRVETDGKLDSVVCKDYFLFTSNLFRQLPDFLVGRGNWDNWMVASAKSANVPVVDVTRSLPAIHQNHDHAHVAGGRKNAYVFGEEAKENQRLAGGRNLVRGSTATWELTEKGLKKRSFPLMSMARDLPKFMTLLRNLLFLGYLLATTSFSI